MYFIPESQREYGAERQRQKKRDLPCVTNILICKIILPFKLWSTLTLFQKEFYSARLGKHPQNYWKKYITGKNQTLQPQSKSLTQYDRWLFTTTQFLWCQVTSYFPYTSHYQALTHGFLVGYGIMVSSLWVYLPPM